MHVEKTTSLTNTMPIPLLGAGIALYASIRRRRANELAILVATATIGLLSSSIVGMSARYLGDYYPLLVVGLAMSSSIVESAKRKSTLVALTCAVLVLIPWSLVANASLIKLLQWL
jgi:hypothetical protein